MAAPLLGEALAQRRHELVETELVDLSPFLGAQITIDHPAQPFLRQVLGFNGGGDAQNALEGDGENDVESVKIAFVLDEERTRKTIELIDRHPSQTAFQRERDRDIRAVSPGHAPDSGWRRTEGTWTRS